MFMKFLLRQIFENGFFAQKKQENRRLFFLFHSFPFSASSSYPVTLSDLAGYNSKSSHNFTKIPPSLLFIVSSLTSRFQPFCLLFFSFFKPFSFASFSRIQPAGDKELETSGCRAICHSVAPFYIHHRSFSFRFSYILHLEPVFFLSRLFTISFFLTSALLLFALPPRQNAIFVIHRSFHFYFSTSPYFFFISSAEFLFFFFISSKLLFVLRFL